MESPGVRRLEISSDSAGPSRYGRLQMRSEIIVAVIGAMALIAASVTTGLITRSNTRSASAGDGDHSPARLSLSWTSPLNGSTISHIVNLSGSVSGLKPGDMVWTFNEPLFPNARGGIYYPDTGPCLVQSETWTCNSVAIGPKYTKDSRKVLGPYRIWAVVLDEADAFDVVARIRCFPIGTPSKPHVTLKASCPDSYQSLPGRDISSPPVITVTRLH